MRRLSVAADRLDAALLGIDAAPTPTPRKEDEVLPPIRTKRRAAAPGRRSLSEPPL